MDQKGLRDIKKNLQILMARAGYFASEALFSSGQEVLSMSGNFVPVDTGTLKSSGYVQTSITQEMIRAYVGYGGINNLHNPRGLMNVDYYSMRMHELGPISAYNQTRGRSTKFLEIPVNHYKSVFPTALAQSMRQAFTSLQRPSKAVPKVFKAPYAPPETEQARQQYKADRQYESRTERG